MGSGQMLKLGPLTLRMFLFVCTLSVSVAIVVLRRKIELYFSVLVLIYSATLLVPTFMAVINGFPAGGIIEDLKPLIFFYNIIFFSLMIKDEKNILQINGILKRSAIILAMGYLFVIFGIYTGILDFNYIYALLDSTTEVFFRGTAGFFYKGFLYLCIGVFFFLDKFSKRNALSIALILIAIVLTFTRGFLVSLALVLTIYLLLFYRNKILSLIILGVSAIVGYLYLGYYTDTIGDKSDSDSIRYIQYHEVKNEADPFSFFIGHGFGKGTYSRPGHLEIAYLEIFHKQGIVGLAFWLILLICIFYSYHKAKLNGNKKMALPYLLSCIFVYLQSFTNPFINNPIGMSVIIISVVVLKRLETLKPTIAI
jgi:O-antigen ligase